MVDIDAPQTRDQYLHSGSQDFLQALTNQQICGRERKLVVHEGEKRRRTQPSFNATKAARREGDQINNELCSEDAAQRSCQSRRRLTEPSRLPGPAAPAPASQ